MHRLALLDMRQGQALRADEDAKVIDRVVGMVGELRGHPALLAIVILQVVTLTMLYFVANGNAERASAREMALIAACGDK